MVLLGDAVMPIVFILFLFFYTQLIDTTRCMDELSSQKPAEDAAKPSDTKESEPAKKPDDDEMEDLLNELDLSPGKRVATEKAWKGMTAEQWASPTPRVVQENLRLYQAKLDQTRNRLGFEAKKQAAGQPESQLATAGTPESQQLIRQLEEEENELAEVTEMLTELQEQMMMEHVMELLDKQGTGSGAVGSMDKSVADAVTRAIQDASMVEGSCTEGGGVTPKGADSARQRRKQ
jgi:hypothetical protein